MGIRTKLPPDSIKPALATESSPLGVILALDLGQTTGWALQANGLTHSGSHGFKPGRFEGGGMSMLRFSRWLTELHEQSGPIARVYFEEVRAHKGTAAAHTYGAFLGQLSAWCEANGVAYLGVPVATIKKHATGKGNAGKDLVIEAMRAKGYQPADDNEADALAILHWAIDQEANHG